MTKRGLRMTEAALNAIVAKRPCLHPSPAPAARRLPRAAKRAAAPSYLEEMLAKQLEWTHTQAALREWRFHPARRWRIDFAWPAVRLALEVQGEPHRIKGRFDRDIEKQQALCLLGWRYLPISSADIRAGRAVQIIALALADKSR